MTLLMRDDDLLGLRKKNLRGCVGSIQMIPLSARAAAAMKRH